MTHMPRFHTRMTEGLVEVATDRLTFRLDDGKLQSVEDYALSLYGRTRAVRVMMLDEACWVSDAVAYSAPSHEAQVAA